ncbi:uncharacterized protein PFLUO_LOCUS4350 [Penicillium psychrofluorescens]|uniref:uncharacterized protein n=1 Tax=Penicillium psychrofluorescens TaxID=3158075 RepID=UPI003CCD2447
MKIILTGSTGYVGSEVLRQCLAHPSITSIISLSRRELDITHPKLRAILVKDFTHYPPEVLAEITGADACVYCLGTNVPVRPPELNRKINFDFAIETARTFAAFFTENQHKPPQGTFKFVYLSGALPEKDPNRRLWVLAENRKMRGELENALLQLGRENERRGGVEIYIARPGFVQPKGAFLQNWLVGKLSNAIMLDHLAACMLQVAMGEKRDSIIENDELVSIGKVVASESTLAANSHVT